MHKLVCHLALFFAISYASIVQQSLASAQWRLAPQENVPVDGCVLSDRFIWHHNGYNTSLPFLINNQTKNSLTSDWILASVPATVLSALVQNSIYPDPYYGLNNDHIPDIFDVGADFYTYWFYLDFNFVPENNLNYYIHLRGINYEADIFLNGRKLNEEPVQGMFLRHEFEITKYIRSSGRQQLALLVSPPNPPGNGTTGQCGDGRIAKSVTCQYMAGWDWVQTTRDRSTGIWDKIYISGSQFTRIKHSHVHTTVPGIRSPYTTNQPDVSCRLLIDIQSYRDSNYSVNISWQLLSLTGEIVFSAHDQVVLLPGVVNSVTVAEQTVKNPKLWWPNGLGSPDLYNSTIVIYDPSTSLVLDTESYLIGFRSISSSIDPNTQGKQFFVNGQKIFIRGGNWIGVDALMRMNKANQTGISSSWYDQEVRMHREMNLNLIRVWGGGLVERPEFYEACDRNGMLVWQEFWITGDCNGQWNDPVKKDSQIRRRYYPDNYRLFTASAKDAILMLRNHPSLFIWVGGNEWPPPQPLIPVLSDLVNTLQPGSQFIPYSLSEGIGPSDGPYGIQNPSWFFSARDPSPFNPEMGSVGLPVAATMRQIMSEEALHPIGPTNPVWKYHKFIPYYSLNGLNFTNFIPVPDQIEQYGITRSLDQYCFQAQIANYVQYKALIEGRQQHMWEWYTGIMIWKTQNPWYGLRGQLYDWFGEQTGGFYGVRSASEPFHIQLNLATYGISVVNHLVAAQQNVTVIGTQYYLNSESTQLNSSATVCNKLMSFAPTTITNTSCNATSLAKGQVSFLLLELRNASDIVISSNFYWLSGSPLAWDAYVPLQHLRAANLSTSILQCRKTGPNANSVDLTILFNNPSLNEIAFFNQLQVLSPSARILPVFYSDNYFSVLPESSKQIQLQFQPRSTEWKVTLSGWNRESNVVLLDNTNCL